MLLVGLEGSMAGIQSCQAIGSFMPIDDAIISIRTSYRRRLNSLNISSQTLHVTASKHDFDSNKAAWRL
jgi:hypothetical protein